MMRLLAVPDFSRRAWQLMREREQPTMDDFWALNPYSATNHPFDVVTYTAVLVKIMVSHGRDHPEWARTGEYMCALRATGSAAVTSAAAPLCSDRDELLLPL
jgi:hypothetical protein